MQSLTGVKKVLDPESPCVIIIVLSLQSGDRILTKQRSPPQSWMVSYSCVPDGGFQLCNVGVGSAMFSLLIQNKPQVMVCSDFR